MYPISSKSDNQDVLLASRFQYSQRRLLFARIRLYADRIELSGLYWKGLHRQVVPLREVEHVEWWTSVPGVVNFELGLKGREPLRLWLKGAGLWKFKIEEQLQQLREVRVERGVSISSAA